MRRFALCYGKGSLLSCSQNPLNGGSYFKVGWALIIIIGTARRKRQDVYCPEKTMLGSVFMFCV